jgi:CHAT domain-containing protein
MIHLCDEDRLKQLLMPQSNTTLSGVNQLYGTKLQNRNEIYQLIWRPLEPVLKGAQTVYFSPDGMLNKISFAALRDQNGRYLSEQMVLHPVLNTAVLASRKEQPFYPGQVQLFGGIDYSYANAPEVWKYLPGTNDEAVRLSELFDRKRIQRSYYKGKEAAESTFNQGSSHVQIVHIASHGFFFPDPLDGSVRHEADTLIGEMRFRSGGSEGRSRFVINPDPMMRSGLVFSGANRVWTDEEVSAEEDGVLTAYEISGMDLSGVKLITLSACETGLGDLHSTEGVFGLQRAFKMAGVQFLIMSLWQVPDKETAEFMVLFYDRLVKRKNIRQAFVETQRVMCKKYDPYFWAAFVLLE